MSSEKPTTTKEAVTNALDALAAFRREYELGEASEELIFDAERNLLVAVELVARAPVPATAWERPAAPHLERIATALESLAGDGIAVTAFPPRVRVPRL